MSELATTAPERRPAGRRRAGALARRAPRGGPPRVISDRALLGLVAAVTLAGLAVAVVLAVRRDMVFAFGDAPTHALIPERVWAERQPGINQLGTHWTPLFHVLQVPFAWLAPLVRSGAAGIFVSALATLVGVVYLCRLALVVGASRPTAFWAAGLLAGCPSFLYVGVIPMMYAVTMASAIVNIYYLTRWAINGGGGLLLAAGLTLTVTTLAHFETWPLIPLEGLIVIVLEGARWRSRLRAEAAFWLWLVSGTYGLVAFLLFNVIIFGSPLAFIGSEGAGVDVLTPLGGLAGLAAYPRAAWLTMGPALSVAAGLGLVCFAWRKRHRPAEAVPLLLLFPATFYAAQTLLQGSLILPGDEIGQWINIRYAVTILPAAAFFATVGLHRWWLVTPAVIAVLASSVLMMRDHRVVTWESARSQQANEAPVEAWSRWFGRQAGEGIILFPVEHRYTDRFELFSGLDQTRFLYVDSGRDWRRALTGSPEVLAALRVRWVIAFAGSGPATRRLARRSEARSCRVPTPSAIPKVVVYDLLRRCPPLARRGVHAPPPVPLPAPRAPEVGCPVALGGGLPDVVGALGRACGVPPGPGPPLPPPLPPPPATLPPPVPRPCFGRDLGLQALGSLPLPCAGGP